MPYLRPTTQRLFYTRQGSHSHYPAVVLVHGAGSSHLVWPGALRRLPNTAVYTLDLPGHGRSDPPGCQQIDDYARQVLAMLTKLEIIHYVIAGHSMGGAIAQAIGRQQPPGLAGLVLLGTSARLPVSPTILENARTNPDKAIDLIIRHAWSAQVPDVVRQQARQQLAAVDPAVLHGDFLACQQFDMTAELAQIPAPALVISGSADRMTPAKYGRALAAGLPNGRYHEIDGAGHYLMVEQPDAVAAPVRDFLHECAARSK